jgi:voltage-gated potassium channel
LTIPKSAETQTYPQKPPETSIPDRSQVVTANAPASTAQRINRNTSTRTTIQRAELCAMFNRLDRRLTERLTSLTLRKAVGLIVAVATTLAFTAAVLERLIEPKVFDTFPQALWFTITTVTTVGYGDLVPESAAGRLVASALMLTGLGLIPVITSVVVSILVTQRGRESREREMHHLSLILERLDDLDRKLVELGKR